MAMPSTSSCVLPKQTTPILLRRQTASTVSGKARVLRRTGGLSTESGLQRQAWTVRAQTTKKRRTRGKANSPVMGQAWAMSQSAPTSTKSSITPVRLNSVSWNWLPSSRCSSPSFSANISSSGAAPASPCSSRRLARILRKRPRPSERRSCRAAGWVRRKRICTISRRFCTTLPSGDYIRNIKMRSSSQIAIVIRPKPGRHQRSLSSAQGSRPFTPSTLPSAPRHRPSTPSRPAQESYLLLADSHRRRESEEEEETALLLSKMSPPSAQRPRPSASSKTEEHWLEISRPPSSRPQQDEHLAIPSKLLTAERLRQQAAGINCSGRKARMTLFKPEPKFDTASPQNFLSSRPSPNKGSEDSRGRINMVRHSSAAKLISYRRSFEREYLRKLKVFLDFLFKVQFANHVYLSVRLSPVDESVKRYRVYVGGGPSHLFVKTMVRHRFWYDVVAAPSECDFYWTAREKPAVHRKQLTALQNPPFQLNEQVPETEVPTEGLHSNRKLLKPAAAEEAERCILRDGFVQRFPSPLFFIVSNHIPEGKHIHAKRYWCPALQEYYEERGDNPWDCMVRCYLFHRPTKSQQDFFKYLMEKDLKKVWLIKEGEYDAYGPGLLMMPAKDLRKRLKELADQPEAYLVQEYLADPLLYRGRKFDIRHFMLLTSTNGILRAYWYPEGLIRTSSVAYEAKLVKVPEVHFLKDSVQEDCPTFGAHQPANKLSYYKFAWWFDKKFSQSEEDEPRTFQRDVLPKMKRTALDLLKVARKRLDPDRRNCNFQLLALDYLVGADLKVYLVDVNCSPELTVREGAPSHVIPPMVEETLQLGVDPFLPPLDHFHARQHHRLNTDPLKALRYQLIYDEG